MAIRLARTVAASSLVRRSTPENSPLPEVHGGGRKLRRASSSSSSSSPDKSKKTEKKLVDRLSSVIDAVNDRKLPPELRGQRNALQIRDINNKVFRYNLIVPFGRQMFGLKWEKEMDRLEEEC
ncbi:hypothetical protein UlMin_005682 [Ulmus minor]